MTSKYRQNDFQNISELFSGSISDFKDRLTEIWFGLYDRDGTSKDVQGSRLVLFHIPTIF